MFHLGGPLSFGAAKGIVHMLAYQQDYQVLLLDLSDAPAIDYSASRAIEDMIIDTLAQHRHVLMALPDGDVSQMLERERVLAALPNDNVHPDRTRALRHAGHLLAP